jgi:hypothetical protein
LTCNTWRYAQPFEVASLAAYDGTCGGSYQSASAFSSDANTVRIPAARCNVPDVFTVYSVDKTKSPPAVTSVDLPYVSSGNTWSVIRLDGGFGMVTSTTTGGLATVVLCPFLDANPISPLPQPVPIAQIDDTSTTYPYVIQVHQVSSSAYFVVTETASTTTPGTFVSTGLAAGGQQANVVQIDTVSGLFTPVMAHVGSSVFIYVAQQSAPASFYQVPDTATAGATRKNVAPLASGSAERFLDAVPGSAPNSTNLAYFESDPVDGGQSGAVTFRASPVANATLPSLTAANIAFGQTFTDVGSVPGPLNALSFFGDDFVALGPGEMSNQDPTTWINFLWLNVNGVVRSDQSSMGCSPVMGPISTTSPPRRAVRSVPRPVPGTSPGRSLPKMAGTTPTCS